MKSILCISVIRMDKDSRYFTMYMEISAGKYYEVVGHDYKLGDDIIRIINDIGREYNYPVKIFDIKQFNREILINSILI